MRLQNKTRLPIPVVGWFRSTGKAFVSAQPAPVHNFTAMLARECASGLPSDTALAALAGHAGFVILATAAPAAGAPDDLPEPVGVTDADGRHLVHIFTDMRRARAWASTASATAGRDEVMSATLPWHGGLRYLLHTPCAGIVVDAGSAERIVLDRAALAHLLAGLALEPLVRRPTVFVVLEGGHVHVESPVGAEAHAFIYDTETAATAVRQMLEARGLPLNLAPRRLPALLLALEEAGIAHLDVNRGLPDAHSYTLAAVRRMEARVLHYAPPAVPTTTVDATRPPVASPVTARAQQGPIRPAQPPLPRTDAEARAFFLEWRHVAVSQTLPVWRFLEALASQAVFYVPRATSATEGLSWPWQVSVRKQPENTDATLVHLFTTEAAARAAVAAWPRSRQRLVKLAGIEAFRWIWASPAAVTDIAIDYPADDGWMVFPIRWLRHALFPLGHELGDLASVPRVPPSELVMLPGAHGLQPDVIHSLLEGWPSLLDLDPAEDGSVVAIERDGRRFLPAFSSRHAFEAFAASHRGVSSAARTAGSRPPFDGWLSAVADLDGVLLDPEATSPLVLDHTALTVLDLWAGRRRAPDAIDLIREAQCRAREGALAGPALARLVAEVPEYWLGMLAPDDLDITVLHMPDDDATGVLFTTQEAAREFFERNPPPRTGRVSRAPGDTTITLLARPHQWSTSAFLVVAEEFDAVVVDPNPDGSGGLCLDRAQIERVLTALDERLMPRVPGFVWED